MNINKIIEYFDLASEYRPGGSRAVTEASTKRFHWFPQYLGLLAGILVQPYLQRYMAAGHWDLSGLWGWSVASAIIALMVFPGVYKESFDVTKPLFVQLCVIFTAGMGWQTLVSSALKSTGVIQG
jgi:hypothetical protein